MKVNYKSDFELTIQLTAGGVDVAAPSWDWQLRFYTFDRQAVYTVAYIDGKAERCAVNTDGTITAYFDKHGLMPGALRCEFVNLVPDSHYTHDTQVQVDPVELGVELWRGASDGGMDAVTLELAGQVLAEVQALAADLQQKAESGYFDGEPGPQGPQGPPGPAGPGLLVVTVTGSDQEALTADHTAGEILAAHDAGRPVVATYGGEVYQLASVSSSLASFSLASADLEVLVQIDVDGDGGAVRIFDEVQGALTAGDGIVIDGTTISAVPEAFVVRMALPQDGGGGTADKEQAAALAAYDAGKVVMVVASVNGVDYTFHAVMTAVWDYTATNRMLFCMLQRNELTGYRVIWHPGGTIIVVAYEPDRAPRLNSANPVTSGGVFTALQSKADTSTTYTKTEVNTALQGKADVTTLVEVTATGDVTQALDSGTFYRFGSVDSLTLTFTAPSAGLGMWGGKFTASASWSALGIPATIDEAAGNDTIAGGKTYEFNMVDNVIVIKEV